MFFPQSVSRGTAAFDRAMKTSGELIERFEEAARSDDPIRAMFADMWLERNNAHYVTSIYETHQEMISPLRQNGKQHR